MINQIKLIFAAIFVAFTYGLCKGKKSIELLENEEAAKEVKKLNKIKNKVHSLPEPDRSKLVRKFTRKDK